jgi:hypothetical protein
MRTFDLPSNIRLPIISVECGGSSVAFLPCFQRPHPMITSDWGGCMFSPTSEFRTVGGTTTRAFHCKAQGCTGGIQWLQDCSFTLASPDERKVWPTA